MNAPLDPSICCQTCQLFGNDKLSRAVDLTCTDCCVRYLLNSIDSLGKFGEQGHVERIKDALAKRLIEDAR